MGEGEPAVNALPKTSEFVTAPAKVISPRKAWMLLSLLLSFPVYMLVSLIYIQSTQGWIFIDPGIYQAGVVVSAVVAVLLIYSMRGRGSVLFSNVLVLMLGTFPVLLMLLVPLLSVAPLRMVHTLLPHDDVVKSLRVELFTSCGSGRRSSSNLRGVVFEEGFGFLNDKNCELPFWLVGELRKADELSWRIERSAIGFSLVKLERVTRGGDMVIDASWRGVRRH
jgi:hypothetical protein